jgi:hypothetical protein
MAIDNKKERFIKVEDNQGTENLSTLYYHKECWHEIMVGKAQQTKVYEKGMKMLNFMGNKMGFEDEVITI